MRRLLPLLTLSIALCATTALAAPPRACPGGLHRAVTAELYFGRDIRGVGEVSEADWTQFVDAEVTPRFPAGFTVLDGYGQWRGQASGKIVAEPSTVVIVVAEPGETTLAALAAIRADYQRRFAQESVGLALADSCASF